MQPPVEFVPNSYQPPAVDFVCRTPGCMLAIEMGLGKTAITLTAIDRLLRSCEVQRVLVIAPKRVAQKTWPDEIEKWAHTRWINYAVAIGTEGARIKAVASGADVTIINRENVDWLVWHCTKRKRWPYDMIVIDESSDFKNPGTARFKALRAARNAAARVVLLTGTPIGNSHLDLWAQLYLIDGGKRLGSTFGGFRDRYFTPGWNGWKWTPREGATKQIEDAIKDVVYVLRAEDWLDMPDCVRNREPVPLDARTLAAYKDMEKKALVELDGQVITAPGAQVVAGKLLQITAGLLYTPETETGWIAVGDDKLRALRELVDVIKEPAVVVYRHRADAERIMAEFPGTMEVRQPGAIDKWNAGKVPILLLHPQSGGFGLNLQYGGRHMIWYGLTYSMIHHSQTVARVHRQGQTRAVLCHYLISPDTIDERVLAILDGKHKNLVEMLEAMKGGRGE